MKKLIIILWYVFQAIVSTQAQEQIDQEIVARIKKEGFQNSHLMETISYLTDIYGPRLLGTPEYYEAAVWVKNKLIKWGLENVQLESFDWGQWGWRAESYSIEMISPRYTPILSFPKAWSRSTDGIIEGTPIVVKDIFHLDSLQKYRDKIKNRIVLINKMKEIQPQFEPLSKRWSDEELALAEKSLIPFPEQTLNSWESKIPLLDRMITWDEQEREKQEIHQLLIQLHPAALIEASPRTHGIIHVEEAFFGNDQNIEPVPSFVISKENFFRLLRMIDKGVQPVLRLHLQSTFFCNPEYNVNIIGDIPGKDKQKRSEIVLIGGHFDSWHAGTGATDNAANCAVLMEAMRIIKTLDLQPERTLRIGLWGGEEVGYHGSRGYVEKHIGNLNTGEYKTEQAKTSVYLNLDHGAGKIRGIFLQGNERARPLFTELLKPFEYLNATTMTIQSTTYTDHEVFDAMNIPSFQFIQDPINYMTVTHHTNMDVYDYVIEEDVKQNAVIIATLVYHLAMRDGMIPRK
jgi:carboxypeptidase Q